eukprot:366353-Chlamydomonas_euryale.AAC.8
MQNTSMDSAWSQAYGVCMEPSIESAWSRAWILHEAEHRDGLDYVQDGTDINYPVAKKRVYMIIRVFSPERTAREDRPNASVHPAYEIVIRNKWSFVKQQGR